jgi:ribosomal protein S11
VAGVLRLRISKCLRGSLLWKSRRSSDQMAGSTGEKAAAEVAAEVMDEGLRQMQMGVERLEVRVRGGRVEG